MPGNLNTGVVRWEAEADGGACLIRVEIYYDNTAAEPRPIVNTSGLNEQGNSAGRALRVWNTCDDRVGARITDGVSGSVVNVTIPAGGDLTVPVRSLTANQLGNFGIETEQQARSLGFEIVG